MNFVRLLGVGIFHGQLGMADQVSTIFSLEPVLKFQFHDCPSCLHEGWLSSAKDSVQAIPIPSGFHAVTRGLQSVAI